MNPQESHFINGEWIAGKGKGFVSFDPATGAPLIDMNEATEKEVVQAIDSARSAVKKWQLTSFSERIDYLKAIQAVVQSKKEELAQAIGQESGKPLWEAKKEVAGMINKIDITQDAYALRAEPNRHPLGSGINQTYYKPIGVMAVLGPFNFPGHLPFGHIIPAILAGNTILFKPSEYTPNVGRLLMQILDLAELPKGVVNGLQGGRETGERVTDHAMIDGVLFTGSYAVGQKLHQKWGTKMEKMLALELGGNNPLIVESTAHPKAVESIIIQSAFITSGQRCSCARRLIMIRSDQNRQLLANVLARMASIRIGGTQDNPEPFMGPLISRQAQEHATSFMTQCVKNGGIYLEPIETSDIGYFCSPGVVDMSESRTIIDQECFAPILQLFWVDSIEEAIEKANQTEYGLTASVITPDQTIFKKCLVDLKAGIINWNAPTTGASSRAPFGGVGHSGNFRPSGFMAIDYCHYPVASTQYEDLDTYHAGLPGITE